MRRVIFVNENTLGHASYMLPFVQELQRRPELGVEPRVIDAMPLPRNLARWAISIRGLRKLDLDLSNSRWRLVASKHVRNLLEPLLGSNEVDSVVVNTQSVALDLLDLPKSVPLHICLDATFSQLARSKWFAHSAASRYLHPLTLAPLYRRERALFEKSSCLFPWSLGVRQSLIDEYGLCRSKIQCLPPSVSLSMETQKPHNLRPRILFIGGDFYRKGGPALLDCFQKYLALNCELHIVTQSDVAPSPGVHIHRNVKANSPTWKAQWEQADVFVFPSTLETFGIVLLEALAHGVPVVATDVGAAAEVLDQGRCGVLLEDTSPLALARAIESVLNDKENTRSRIERGRQRVSRDFDITKNTEQLADCLHRW